MDRSQNIIHSNSGARLVVLHYVYEPSNRLTVAENMKVAKVETEDILKYNYSKSLGEPSGTFSISLLPTRNWKKLIRNGDWLVLYMQKNGKEVPKILNVDRVARIKEVDENGTVTVTFIVSGRDYGKVLEKTNIYYNPFLGTAIYRGIVILTKEGILRGTPTFLVKKFLDIYLGNSIDSKVAESAEKADIAELNQWFIPQELKWELGISSKTHKRAKLRGDVDTSDISINEAVGVEWPSFYDILNVDYLQETDGAKTYDDSSNIQGILWNLLKEASNEQVNELFLEHKTVNGITEPALIMRSIPFTEPSHKFKAKNNIGNDILIKMIDLDRIVVEDKEIWSEDLGETDHVKFNFFLLSSTAGSFSNELLSIAYQFGEIKYPRLNAASIQRNGTLLRTDSTDFAFEATVDNKDDFIESLKAFNERLYYWWKDAHKFESGVMEIDGNPYMEVGKALEARYSSGETYLYYIEGYTHTWDFPNIMQTSLQLTRGRRLIGSVGQSYIEDANDNDKKFTGQTYIDRKKT